MDFLKQWTLCVCYTLTAAAILSLFTPKGKMKDFYKVLIALFVFVSFIYPLKDFNGFESVKPILAAESQTVSNEKIYKDGVAAEIKSVLKENNVSGVSVNVELTVNDSEITINEVQISVPDEYEKESVKSIVFEKLGIIAKVIHIGE